MKKVAIVGFANSKDQAPYDDPSFEIWSCNNLHDFIPRTDRIFQIHKREETEKYLHGVPGRDHMEYLKKFEGTVYTIEKWEDVPGSVAYPLDKMVEEFGIPRSVKGDLKDAYFTNSISFMIALAIHEGFGEIHVYGVDMAVMTEYSEQRPSCEYYLGIAVGRGIKVYIPPESDLLKTRFTYGFQDEEKAAWQAKLDKTLEHIQTQHREAVLAAQSQQSVTDKYEGAIEAYSKMRKTKKVKAIIEQLMQNKLQSEQLCRQNQSIADKYEGAQTAVLELNKAWG